jgi:DNA-binding response OmpR family regulator
VRKVLVVDDDKESRELLSEVLATNGYSVGSVENAEAARDMLQGNDEYGIIIADLRMPGGGGLDLLRALRLQNTKHDVILMSSFISGAERKMALDLGVDGLLEKPFRLTELLELVAGLANDRTHRGVILRSESTGG